MECIFSTIYIYFQKSTYVSRNIPESQNAIHNICRVRDFERNKNHPFVLSSKLWDSEAISFAKKGSFSRSKLPEEI